MRHDGDVGDFVRILESLTGEDARTETNAYVRTELRAAAAVAEQEFAFVLRVWQTIVDDCVRRAITVGRIDEVGSTAESRAVGEEFASLGMSLHDGLRTVMALRRIALEAVRRQSLAEGRSAAFIARAMSDIAQSMNTFMIDLNEGHLAAELATRARQAAIQDAFVWEALTGTSPSADTFTRLDVYGMDSSASYHAFRARPATDSGVVSLSRHLGLDPEDSHRVGLATNIDGDMCGFLTMVPAADAPGLVAVSGPVPFTDLPSAFQRATRAFSVAERMGLTGLQSMKKLGLLSAVAADRDIAREVDAVYLAPLRRQKEYGDILLETIRSYIDNDGQLDATAEALDLHVNTVRYRIAKYEEIIGRQLRDTRVLAETWWAVSLPMD